MANTASIYKGVSTAAAAITTKSQLSIPHQVVPLVSPSFQMVRMKGLDVVMGKKKSSCYMDINDGLLPPPVSIGGRSTAWPLHELQSINAARIAGKTDVEIRELVKKLVDARKTADQGVQA